MSFEPVYLDLLRSGVLHQRVAEANAHLSSCDLCAHACKVDRYGKKLGVCQTGARARVSSYGPHHGEENPLRGWRGSGTIFFCRCNLKCQYCQNYEISQEDSGKEVEPEELADIMMELQKLGCHNINLVSPSHVVAPILAAILIAAINGLRLPLIYNTGGYDSITALKLLDGVIDIYMPDMKYADADNGYRYSKAKEYPAINQAAVREMHRQVGDLLMDENGIAQRGILVRHLVLPNNLAGTEQIIHFLANQISQDTYLNLMDQYRPAYHAGGFEELNRPANFQEYQQALALAHSAGLKRLDNAHRFIHR